MWSEHPGARQATQGCKIYPIATTSSNSAWTESTEHNLRCLVLVHGQRGQLLLQPGPEVLVL